MAIGPNPRRLEELQIGGGFGEAVDGGADIEKNGDISTDGNVTLKGVLSAGSTPQVLTNAAGELDGGKIQAGTVGTAQLANDAVDATKLDETGSYAMAGLTVGGDPVATVNNDAQELSTETLLALYHMESLTTLPDWSGSGNAATPSGVALVEGKYGSALSFDGVNDYVITGTSDIPDAYGNVDISFSAWVKPDAASSGWVLGWSYLGGALINGIEVSASKAAYFVQDGVDWKRALSTGTIDDGQWHHIVGVRDVTANTITLYLDGEEVDQQDATVIGDTDPGVGKRNIILGAGNNGGINSFDGPIDEASIWGKALSATEVKSLYEMRHELKAEYGDRYMDGDLFVQGTMSAETVVDRSPAYTGTRALGILADIRTRAGTQRDDFAEVDHATLGPLLVEITEGGLSRNQPPRLDENGEPIPAGPRQYRDLGKQIQVNSAAVLELLARVQALETP